MSGRKKVLSTLLSPKHIIVTMTVLGVMVTLGLGYLVFTSYKQMSAKPVDKVNDGYVSVKASNDSGVDVFFNKIGRVFTVEGFNGDSSLSRAKIDYDGCQTFPLPTTPVRQQTFSKIDGFVSVEVYTIGGAYNMLSHYVDSFSKCLEKKIPIEVLSNGAMFTVDNVSVVAMGDVIFYSKNVDKDWLVNIGSKVLSDSRCLNLSVNVQDVERNPFSFPEYYRGFFETKTTSPISRKLQEPSFSFIIKSLDRLDKVLLPLPKDLEDEKKKLDSFNMMSIEQRPSILPINTYSYSYRVEDKIGPNCGWDWHKMLPPVYDIQALLDEKRKVESESIIKAENALKSYLDRFVDYSWDNILVARKLDEQNNTISELNDIIKQLNMLGERRKAMRPEWNKYLQDLNQYYGFKKEQENAKKQYTNMMQECEKKNKERKERLKNNNIIVQNNKECTIVKPEILSYSLPEYPIRPVFAEDTPIPYDWEKEEKMILDNAK